MVTLSVIVPVYNVEPYLRRCLDSIENQTFADWECIIVDDGSPDGSAAICDEYAARDGRFRVIHQQNKGVSAARNAGLDAAKSEWISFVDSDDWIDVETYENAVRRAEEAGADVLIFGYALSDGKKDFATYVPKNGILNAPTELAEWQGPCAKLFKKSTLHTVRFPAGITIAEDLYFTFQIYFSNVAIFGYNKVYYHYFQNPKSAMHCITEKSISDELYVIAQLESFFVANTASSEWFDVLQKKKIFAKNKWLFAFRPPRLEKRRNCYPELTNYLIQTSPFFQRLLFSLIAKKRDFLTRFLLWMHGCKKILLGKL